VLANAEAFAEGRLFDVRRLMTESHSSLKNDFDVTTHELDLMMQLSLDQRGCVGARMTGTGCGGCIVALFEETHTKAALERDEGLQRLHWDHARRVRMQARNRHIPDQRILTFALLGPETRCSGHRRSCQARRNVAVPQAD
jgi:hypothetical protein